MQDRIGKIEGAINASGMQYDKGSVYDRFCKLTDLRGENGKRYELSAVLTIIVLAKLCGEDKLMGIAEWAKHRKEEFGITSLTRKQASPLRILHIRRAHWGIETGLHYRRDVTLHEDATRMTVGNTGKVMASINNLVLALIRQAGFHNAAQARRCFAAHLSDAFALLTTPFSR